MLLLVAVGWPGFGDSLLDQLHASLVAMRGKPVGSEGARGGSPKLTAAKHLLRDWVEARLTGWPERGDEGDLQRKLNADLSREGLFCGTQTCPDWTKIGFLDKVTLRRESGFIILQTAVGIDCGYDDSVYIYAWSPEGWRRVWQNEQNTYTDKEYKPQHLQGVHISPHNTANDYLVLTLGTEPWCQSAWHDAYYRAYRLGPDPNPEPILSGGRWAYLGDYQPPIRGAITLDDIFVEYIVASIDGGREEVEHYKIDHDKVKRIDPLALSPRDFVDEWLISDWSDAYEWSESPDRGSLADAHKKLHNVHGPPVFVRPTLHCPKTPDLWQVGVSFDDLNSKPMYFLVRWRPPYRFTMVRITAQPSPACTEADPFADEHRTLLFLDQ